MPTSTRRGGFASPDARLLLLCCAGGAGVGLFALGPLANKSFSRLQPKPLPNSATQAPPQLRCCHGWMWSACISYASSPPSRCRETAGRRT